MQLPLNCPPMHTGVLLPDFFDKTFLPVHVMKLQGEETIPLSYLIDRFAGLIKVPFLVMEAKRMQDLVVNKGVDQKIVGFVRALSFGGNVIEFGCWVVERGYFNLGVQKLSILRKIYYTSKIILYSYSVLVDSHLVHESKSKKERYYANLLLFSHMMYLSCMMFGAAYLTFGVTFPRQFLRTILLTSLLFDMASRGYEENMMSKKQPFTKSLTPLSPKQNLYT